MYMCMYTNTQTLQKKDKATQHKTLRQLFTKKSCTQVGLKHIHITAGDEWRLPIYVSLFYCQVFVVMKWLIILPMSQSHDIRVHHVYIKPGLCARQVIIFLADDS